MWKLYGGVLLFGGAHLLAMLFPEARSRLLKKYGEGAYRGVFSLVSLVGLVLLGMAYWAGRSGPNALNILYTPIDSARPVMMLLVLAGFILIFARQSKGHIQAWVKHPFSAGIALLSFGHLLVNGETAVVVVFGTFLALSVIDVALNLARGKGPTHVPSFGGDVRAIALGVVLYLVFLFGFHPYVLNIPVAG